MHGLKGAVRNMLHPMHVLHMYLYSLIYAHYAWAQLGLEPPVVYQDYKSARHYSELIIALH